MKYLDVSPLELGLALFADAIDEDVQRQMTAIGHFLEFPSGNQPHVKDLNLLVCKLLVLCVILRGNLHILSFNNSWYLRVKIN